MYYIANPERFLWNKLDKSQRKFWRYMKSQQPFPGHQIKSYSHHECSCNTRGRWQLWGEARPRKVCTLHFSQSSVTLSTSHLSLVINRQFCSFGLQLRLHRKPTGWAQLWPWLFTEGGCNEERRNAHICLRVNTLLIVVSRLQSYPFRVFRCLLCKHL